MSKAIDRATAFKNEVAGHGTYKIICKASNHDLAGPKKKHVDFLLHVTNNPRSQMSYLGDLISDRLKNSQWVVVFKTLIVAHNLMTLGHERFLQCLATRSQIFTMDNYHDRSDALASEMSMHLKRYGKYLACICTNYKAVAMDVSRIPKGDNSPFKSMDPVKILKSADLIQKQLDLLLEVELTSGDLTNGVINTAFLMLYKDLVKLYTVYNDCIINLLEKFFEMKKPQCRETIEFYRRFLTRQEGVQTFLSLAEQVGIDKQTHLNLRQVPEDLLPALENHLTEMDSLKKANSGEASPSIRAASEKLAALKGTEKKTVSFTKSSSPPPEALPSASSDVLEAQRKRFEELKRQASIPKSMDSATSLSSQESKSTPTKSSSDDLLGLDGAFTTTTPQNDPWGSSPNHAIPSATPSNPFQPVSTTTLAMGNGTAQTATNDPWGAEPQAPSAYQEVDFFTEIRSGGSAGRTSFDAVFSTPAPSQTSSQFMLGGDILQPQAAGPLVSSELLEPANPPPGLTKDVDSSLAKAAASLTVDLGGSSNKAGITKKTEHMWTPQKEYVKTGGMNFQKQGIQARTLPANDPMKGGTGTPVDWNKGMYGGHFPQQGYPQQGYPTQPMGPPATGYGVMGPPQPQPFGVQPAPGMMQPQGGNPWYPAQQQQPFQPQPNDPFGAIPSQNASLF